MTDLFRFVVLRSADWVASDDIDRIAAGFAPPGTNRDVAQKAARTFLDRPGLDASLARVKYSGAALQVANAIGRERRLLADVAAVVKSVVDKTPGEVVEDPAFASERRLVEDVLVAIKLLSRSNGLNATELAAIARGYDAIQRAADGRDPIALRFLSVADYPAPAAPPPISGGGPANEPPGESPAPPRERIAEIDRTLKSIESVPASAFRARADDTPAATTHAAPAAAPKTGAPAWLMSADAVHALPAAVRGVLASEGLDPQVHGLPRVVETLHARKVELQAVEALSVALERGKIVKVGNSFDSVARAEYVGAPASDLPTGHGNIRPVGVGDLLLVKEHVLRYEGGELAHVENVLKSEHMSRETRRLERTETTVFQERETTSEQTRDTQTTERFSLKRETSETIRSDAALKAGLSVDAKYGPTVSVHADTEFSTSNSSESSVKQASEFSQDVVERSVARLVERVLERRSITTTLEFEEKYSHGFDNNSGAHISGVYQWIDKVVHAQVYNYGKRLLFDVTVPEPSTNFVLMLTHARDVAQTFEKPEPFTATAADLNEGNYVIWAKKYDATGIEAPPPPVKTVVKTYDGVFTQPEHESSKSDVLTIDDGYQAQYASFVKDAVKVAPDAHWRVFVGSAWFDAMSAQQYVNMAGEVGSLGVAYDAYHVRVMSASIEVFCVRTERAMTAWRLKTHAAITQAYLAKVQVYEHKLSEARAAAEAVIAGRNPGFNRSLIATELRRQCLTLLTSQQFDSFGALELTPEGYAQPHVDRAADQMPYVRFFELAFEWEHLVYHCYPYFWGWKPGWKNRMLLDDVDPTFANFLRSGAARVVFPVRPGFETAVLHYIETGQIWNGGPPPDITSPLYVPIVKEIQEATGAPGNEQPVGEPWEVRLPTTLVRLRPHDDLPAWQKVGETWQPVN